MIQCWLLNGLRAYYIKLNEDKCHFLLYRYKHKMMLVNTGQSRIWKSEKQKLLGVTIDKHLKFQEHIVKQCKKPEQKLSTLARVCKILNQERRTLKKAFVEFLLGHFPLICMFCGGNLNNQINHLHARSLRTDYQSSL